MPIAALINRPARRFGVSFRSAYALAALTATSLAGAQGAPTTTPSGSSTYAYDIPLFRDDTSFMNPSNTWTYFFEVRPGVRLVSGAYLSLNYNSSTTLVKGQGSLTVLLNNVPIASRKLAEAGDQPWKVQLPVERFKAGYNELRIVSRQRSLDGPCQDLDNLSNWVRFGKSSRLHLVREDKATFPIASYPFPFLDNLETNPVNATWVLPSQPSDAQIGQVLKLASDWGLKERIRSLPIRVALSEPSGQALLIGAASQWRPAGAPSVADGDGLLQNFSRSSAPGSSRMLVSGSNDAGVNRARETLSHPEMVEQIVGTSAVITSDPAEDPARPSTRMEPFTLTDLGFPAITLSGAFHQRATITVLRPIRADLGKESWIHFKFRHSASLNPLRSILSIFLNGTPIASARLDQQNANEGTIDARIPVEELAKSRWVIEVAAYHDLAAVDCSKTYDDVAWTVLQGESTIDLKPGNLTGRPYLESFPYLIGKDGLPPSEPIMSLSSGTDETQLSIAARLAARAAQVNRTSLNWQVHTADLPQGSKGSIVVGYFNEANRFAPIKDSLLACPTANGSWDINPKIRLVPSALAGATVIQAVKSGDDGVMYVVMAADQAALRRFAQVLNDPDKVLQMNGEVVVINQDGGIASLSSVDAQAERAEQTREQDRYTPSMQAVKTGIIAVLIAGILAGISAIRPRPTH